MAKRKETEKARLGRLHWRSRRGIAEVELKLLPFLHARFSSLSPADQDAYDRLLEADDWQIHDWLEGRAEPATPELAGVINLIRRFGQAGA